MSSNPFFAKYGIVVGNTSANSIILYSNGSVLADSFSSNSIFSNNLTLNNELITTSLSVGNSTINSSINSTSGMFYNKSTIGNSTVNVSTNSTVISISSNTNYAGGYFFFGNNTSNVSANAQAFRTGNNTVNVTVDFFGINFNNLSGANSTNLWVGSNVNITQDGITFGNSSVNVAITSTSVNLGVAKANTTTFSVGSDVSLNSTTLSVGNSTVNTSITSSSIKKSNVEAAYTNVYITGSGLANVNANLVSNVVVSVPAATVAEIRASSNNNAIGVTNLWNALAVVTLTDGATINWDMSTGVNFSVTLAGNRTMALPTNIKAGQSGYLFVIQDATGSRTLAWNAVFNWKSGTLPVLTTTAGRVDKFSYFCYDTGNIYMSFELNNF